MTRYTLTLAPDPPGPDCYGRTPEARLRLALKHLGRLFGLRVVAVSPAGDAPEGSARQSGMDGCITRIKGVQ